MARNHLFIQFSNVNSKKVIDCYLKFKANRNFWNFKFKKNIHYSF